MLITRHSSEQQPHILNGLAQAGPSYCAYQSDAAKTSNMVNDNFSLNRQGTLYPAKLFGIMSLFEHCRELSTASCPLYEECGDRLAQS
jgi:hypothetical protein